MKIISAWFLLFISTAHWVGGCLCFEVSYLMEVRREMSETEMGIAESLEEDLGIEGPIRIMEKSEMTLRGNFYNDFVFSKEMDSSTVYYTIEYPAKTLTYEQIAYQQPHKPDQNSSDKSTLLKSLFTDFIFPSPVFPSVSGEIWTTHTFHVAENHGTVFNPIISPPPDLA